ncbi:MAG: response regulator [Phycisphaerales bacterium]|nr:response regulator [Phycisphaerales bacterium]
MASSSPHKKVSCLDSLKLSEREHQELLQQLRDEESQSKAKNRRNDQRIDYNITGGIIIQVHHPGGSVANYMIRTRNLSKHGMGFLHGNFLHSGTPCLVALRRIDHHTTTVAGEVRRCRLIHGRVHEIGIRFQAPIEIDQYINLNEPKDTDAGKPSIKLPELMGRVLYAEDSINDQELLKFQLKTLGMEVITVSNGPEALLHAEVEKFDLIITNIWLPGMTGPELAMCLRDKGYKGIILALTTDAARILAARLWNGAAPT